MNDNQKNIWFTEKTALTSLHIKINMKNIFINQLEIEKCFNYFCKRKKMFIRSTTPNPLKGTFRA